MARRSSVKQPEGFAEMVKTVKAGIEVQAKRPNLYGYVPHDKQYLFHKSTAHTTLYIGGNRSGKTVGGSVETIYRLMGRHPFKKVKEGPVYGRVHTVDFDYGLDMIILPLLSKWMPPSYLIDGSWERSYDKEHKVLHLNNGSFLEARSYQQEMEKFAGTSRDFNWFDEEPPRHIFNESQARLVDTDGDAFLTMTPVDGMTWVHNDIYEPGILGTNKDIYVIEISMEENPHLDASARERYLSTLDPEERKAREHGQFVALGGRIFKEFNKVLHVVPFDGIPPATWQHYATFDHGFNNPTAILWHAVSPSGDVITYSEHYASELTVDEHAKIYHSRNAGFGRVPDLVVGDPAMGQRSGITGTSILQEYSDRGIYIGCERTDVDSGLNRMIQYLKVGPSGKPRWQITENCSHLVSEMQKYRWATYSSRKMQFEKNAQEKPHKKDDHAIDSTRYMYTFLPDLSPLPVGLPTGPGDPLLGRDSGRPLGVSWDDYARKSVDTNWDIKQGGLYDPMEYD